MLIQKNLKLHKKALNILEMIETCENRLADYRGYLKKPYAAYHCSTRFYYERNIDKHVAIRQRLINYYADVMLRLVSPVVENARLLGTIVINEKRIAEPQY